MTSDPDIEPPDLRDYIGPILRRWRLILAIVVCCGVTTYIYYDRQTPKYEARTAVFFEASEVERFLVGESDFGTDRAVVNQSRLFETPTVAREAARRAGYGGPPEELLRNLSVVPRTGQDFLDVLYEDTDPRRAANLANQLTAAFVAVQSAETRAQIERSQGALRSQLKRLPRSAATTDQRAQLQARLEQLEAVSALPSGSAKQVTRAEIPSTPTSPKPLRNALFAVALSLLLAVAAAFGLDRFDRRIRRVIDIEDIYGQPVLSSVPHCRQPALERLDAQAVDNELVEAMRTLRANIGLNSLDRPVRRIMVCSAEPAEGKSTIVRNLALSYAEAGHRVLVVECDLRKPVLDREFHLEEGPGLVDVLARHASLADAVRSVAIAPPGPPDRNGATNNGGGADQSSGTVHVLRAGTGANNPSAVLSSDQLWDLISGLEKAHDITLLDSAPLLMVSDGLQQFPRVDSVLLVTRIGRSTRDAARSLLKLLTRVPDVRLLGVVANDVTLDDRQVRGYYYGGPVAQEQLSRT